MAAAPYRPLGERGSAAALSTTASARVVQGWASFVDASEYVPEWAWPDSVGLVDQMRGDSQIHALYNATTWPIRRYRWRLDPRNADRGMVANLAEDLGLPILGRAATPGRPLRFDWGQHLHTALMALLYGHYVFEQVGVIEEGIWRLRKLAPRPPHTIEDWDVADDGGLDAVIQQSGTSTVRLAINRLVVYVWDQEPGRWTGRSMLRSVYRNWLIKDQLIRIDAINHERAGGMPFITGPPGASQRLIEELDEMAQEMKVGERSGGAAPAGTTLTTPGPAPGDVIASVSYHDEAMARAWLAMFMQLGSTQTGSRALGDAFIDWFDLAQETIAEWVADTFTTHVIGDWFAINVGEDAPLPALVYETGGAQLSVADLAALINSGAIVPDPNLRAQVRDDYGLPEAVEPEAVPVEPPAPTVPPSTPPPVNGQVPAGAASG